jgi:hypothetical protein
VPVPPEVIAPQASGAVVPGPPLSMAAVMATTSASIWRTCKHNTPQPPSRQHTCSKAFGPPRHGCVSHASCHELS